MDFAVDISPKHRELLCTLLRQHLPGVEVWAYGSRVTGKARPSSDLDLAVFVPPELKRAFEDLREALDESNLPFQVDLFMWDDIPEKYKTVIRQQHTVLVNKD